MSVDHATPAFWAALSAFQAAVKGVSKDRKNPHLNNRYATLEAVFDAVREPLAGAGLSVTQLSVVDNGMAGCRTVVAHAEGGYIYADLLLPVVEQKGITIAQSIGISLSYARRYALMGILGLATADEDTDGGPPAHRRVTIAPARANGPPGAPERRPEPAASLPSTDAAEGGWDAYIARLDKMGMTPEVVAAICASRNRPLPGRMTDTDRAKLLLWLDTDAGRAGYRAAAAATPTSTGDGPPSPDPAAYPFPPPPAEGVTYGKWTLPQQRAFMAEIARYGFAYDDVAALCEARGRGRPSVMPPADRATLLRWLQTAEARAALPRPPTAGGDQ